MAYYLETNDEKFAIQIGNFGSKVGGYQTTFGLSDAEVKGAVQDAACFQWTVINIKKVETFKRNWTSFKNITRKGATNVVENLVPEFPVLDPMPPMVVPGIAFRFRTLANRIKAHQNYTVSIGQNLGIELTAAQKLEIDASQPSLKVVMRGGKVNLDWKKNRFDGIVIEKDSGNGFVTLDKALRTKYIDNSALPAQGESAIWKYRAMYLLNDDQVGLWSDIVITTVMG